MKILFINKYMYLKGGSEKYMFSLAEELERRGHDVCFFGMKSKDDIVENKYGIETIDFKDSSCKNKLKFCDLIYSKKVKKKLENMIEEENPDIIHINIFNYQLTTSVIDAAKKYSKPIVHTIHDSQICCPYHRLYNFNKMELCKKCTEGKFYYCIKNRCLDNSLGKSVLATCESYFNYLTKKYKKIDLYISPSSFMASLINDMYKNKLNIKVMNNFADDIVRSENRNYKKYVLFFGRLSKEKGVDTFIKSAQINSDINYKICGTGDMLDKLKDYCIKNYINNVEFLGFNSGEELKKIIKNAKFTIYPSIWYENCPLSIIESKSMGVPVIGSDIGGIPELINDNSDGLLFRRNDYKDLSLKIKELYYDEDRIKLFSERCIEDSLNRFSIKNYGENLEKEYFKLLR